MCVISTHFLASQYFFRQLQMAHWVKSFSFHLQRLCPENPSICLTEKHTNQTGAGRIGPTCQTLFAGFSPGFSTSRVEHTPAHPRIHAPPLTISRIPQLEKGSGAVVNQIRSFAGPQARSDTTGDSTSRLRTISHFSYPSQKPLWCVAYKAHKAHFKGTAIKYMLQIDLLQ